MQLLTSINENLFIYKLLKVLTSSLEVMSIGMMLEVAEVGEAAVSVLMNGNVDRDWLVDWDRYRVLDGHGDFDRYRVGLLDGVGYRLLYSDGVGLWHMYRVGPVHGDLDVDWVGFLYGVGDGLVDGNMDGVRPGNVIGHLYGYGDLFLNWVGDFLLNIDGVGLLHWVGYRPVDGDFVRYGDILLDGVGLWYGDLDGIGDVLLDCNGVRLRNVDRHGAVYRDVDGIRHLLLDGYMIRHRYLLGECDGFNVVVVVVSSAVASFEALSS